MNFSNMKTTLELKKKKRNIHTKTVRAIELIKKQNNICLKLVLLSAISQTNKKNYRTLLTNLISRQGLQFTIRQDWVQKFSNKMSIRPLKSLQIKNYFKVNSMENNSQINRVRTKERKVQTKSIK